MGEADGTPRVEGAELLTVVPTFHVDSTLSPGGFLSNPAPWQYFLGVTGDGQNTWAPGPHGKPRGSRLLATWPCWQLQLSGKCSVCVYTFKLCL